MVITQFRQSDFALSDVRTYTWGALFIIGNMVLPQLCHLVPDGGKIFLPIYFFTLIASYKYGLKVGLLTAILSPLCNHLLFGMPPSAMLPVILVKSSLLTFAAAYVAGRTRSLSLLHILVVVLAYQVVGGMAEWGLTGEWQAAVQDFRLGYPGMLLQVILGWAVLKFCFKN